MKDFQKNIDKLVSKILNEEIESRVKHITETKGQWEEIDMDEELHGNQSKIDVAEPKGKITAADFKKLRDAKSHKKEVEEYYYYSDEDIENAEKLSQDEPTYVGKGLVDNKIKNKIRNKFVGSFDEEVDEEAETDEGNAFTGALANAKKSGDDSFEVDGKEYHVNESKDKWIQDTGMKKGALHKKLGIPEGEKIPKSKLNSIKKDLMAKAKGDKKLSASDSKLLKQVNMALTLSGLKENKNTLALTENELIDMIENIVKEQIVKDPAEKNNFGVNKPQGLKKTEKAQGESKKENDDYAKNVVKKMKDYMKDMYMGGGSYDENPDDFPQSNYQMEKDHKEMKYNPSEAVEEYIEAFSYPGMTNLVYDEIKPDDKKIEKYIKGDSTTGNAVKDKDGKALGNVVPSKVGEKFKKNFDENLYGAEQKNASYKRQSQPVDVAGENTQKGSLKSKKSSASKAQSVLDKVDESNSKEGKVLNEEFNKMKHLMGYNKKTQ